jgi:hypothetical protein
MILIPDDPIIRSMERTGYPPWITEDPPDIEEIEEYEQEEEESEDNE